MAHLHMCLQVKLHSLCFDEALRVLSDVDAVLMMIVGKVFHSEQAWVSGSLNSLVLGIQLVRSVTEERLAFVA